jgi:hypothetical protein
MVPLLHVLPVDAVVMLLAAGYCCFFAPVASKVHSWISNVLRPDLALVFFVPYGD